MYLPPVSYIPYVMAVESDIILLYIVAAYLVVMLGVVLPVHP